jgi:hypothetical protein
MRLFFHLTNGLDFIPDEEGVDVPSLEWARREAQVAVQELRRDDDFDPTRWSGWRLEVTDPDGIVVMHIRLSHG